MRTTRSILYTSAAVFSLVASGTAFAAPEGGVVSRGSATITQAGKKTDIRQKSNKVILDWRSFDIGADEHTQFYQPSKNAIALNRINDVKASQIDGKLTANGNIMLINPNGVVFGKGAQVNVGSLTATTANIDDDDFMAGKMDFKQAGNTAGKIVNNGSITVKDAGLVNFVAPQVENNGTIVAKLGKVQLAAADTFTLDMAGDGILQVAVSPEDGQKIAKNSGDITAQGGYVAVTAAKARGLIDSLVDNSGVIEASSMTAKGGKIILSAEGGTTKTSGTIKANGKKGGGEILIGGDYQGVGTTPNSKNTEVSSGAVIEASATSVGNGGKVIVWADGNTNYAGSIKAQGGVNGGNGGFVETSGKGNLHVAEGSGVTASARNDEGEAGVWLLDPSNVTITDGSGDTIPGSGGTVNPPHDSYTINASSISAALNGGNNVIIATTSGSGEAGDITVTNATISKTVTNNSVGLSLRAARNITIENSSITSSANGIGLTINADRDANSTGAVKISNSNINLNGGSLVIGGGTTVASTPVYASQDGVFDAGVTIDNSTIQTLGAGNITIRGTGENTGNNNYGIWIKNNSLLRTSTTGSTGTITLIGTGGAGGNNNHGVYITGGSTVRSDRGATITGTGGSNGTIGSLHNVGVMIDGGAKVEGRGTGPAMGSITITGVGGAGYGQNHGVQIADDTSRILNTDGDLIIHGTSGYNAALGASPGTNYGFGMSSNSSIESIGTTAGEAGNITITSIGEDTVLGGGAITSVAGNIGINTDSLNMALGALGSTSGNITIAPYEDSASIGLGGGAGKLNLTDAELATINTGGKLVIGKSGAGTGDIDLDSWDWSSKNFSGIEIYGNDIDIGGMTMGAGNFLAHAMDNGVDTGSLNVSAAITRSVNGVATLDLRADQDITVNAHITANDANSDADGNAATSADSLNVILNADRDNDDNGSIATTGSNITTLGGYFVAGGGSGTIGGANGILGDGDGTGADDDYAYILGSGNALSLTTTNITTSGGHAVLNGFAFGAGTSDGIVIDRSKVWTGNGDLIIKGRSTGNTGNPKGLTLSGDVNTRTAELVTTGGDIKISATTTSAQAIYLWDDSQISTTDGDIEITAYTSGTTPSLGAGGATATNHITSTNGNITLALDDANLSGISAITAGNTLTIKGYDPSMSIGLGGGAGSLNLNDNELAKLFANKLVIGDALLGTGDIYIDTWDLSGKTFDVEIYGNAISIGGMTMGVGNFLAHAMDNGVDDGDIGISANITRSVNGVATLDLRADHNIKNSNDADIIAYDANSDGDANPATSPDRLNVILNADRDGDHSGAILLTGAAITTLGGNFIAGGGSGDVGGLDGILGNGDGTGADDAMAWGNGSQATGITLRSTSNVNTGTGSVYLNGHGNDDNTMSGQYGINLQNGGNIATTSGAIKINGYGGVSTQNSYGINMNASTITTETGFIDIYVHSGAAPTNNSDFAFFNNSILESTGSGSIRITGGSNSISNFNIGTPGANRVGSATMTGDIEIIGDTIQINDTDNSILSQGNIYIKPLTDSQSIGLGGGNGGLNLTDSELSNFNGTGKLIIGNSGTGTGDIDLNSWDLSSKLFDVELYGNDIDIGGLIMGAGDFMAYAKDDGVNYGNLILSAGISRAATGDATLDLRADRNLSFNSDASIMSANGRLNVLADADYNNAAGGAIIYNASSIATNGGDITFMDGFSLNGDTNWNAGGGTFTTGGNLSLGAHDLTVVADNVALGGNIAGNANSVLVLKSYDDNRSIGLGGGAGGFNLTDAELSGLNVGHLVIGDAATGNGDIAIQSWSLSGKSYDIELYGRDMDINGMTMGAGDVTMIAGGDVTVNGTIGNSGAGGDLYIDVGNDFENTAGASAISLGSGGRFLIYIDDLSHITRGGMTTGNLFGRDYTNDDPSSINTSFGNRFVFDETPTITVTANDVTLGAYDPGYNSFTYSVTGLATGDTAGSALGGNPSYGKSQLTPTTYSITPSTGTLTSTLGYLIAFQNGTLTMPVDPGGTPPPTTTPPTQPPPAVSLPPSVEHQIQLPQLLFSEGYQVVTSQNASFMSNNEGMLIQRKLDGFRVNTNEADAFVRMIMGGYLQIEQPVVDYYGLSSYESEEF